MKKFLFIAALVIPGPYAAVQAQHVELKSVPSLARPGDNSLRVGVLGNGLKYVIKVDTGKKGLVSVKLRALAGSEYESFPQLAHLIEHLTALSTDSNGRRIERPEMIRHEESIGVKSTANTSYKYASFY